MTTPPKPDQFHPELPPPGFQVKFISFWRDRPKINPRLQLVHTNAAEKQAGIEAIYNWANQPGSGHTIPHCQIQRDGAGYVLLPSDRKGIANYKAADFSLGFETQDTGTLDDPTISAFTEKQAEAVAVACAYYSMLHNIPLTYPATWDGSGTASHTEPFGYPLWTNSLGKSCPGSKKKAQVRDLILPRAQEIVAAWTEPAPPPDTEPTPEPEPGPVPTPQEDAMQVYIGRDMSDGRLLISMGGVAYRRVKPGADENGVASRMEAGVGPKYYNPKRDNELVTDFAAIPELGASWVVAMGVELGA